MRKDFQYCAAKDRAMAAASVGLILWDGESHGTLMNVMRLAAEAPTILSLEVPWPTLLLPPELPGGERRTGA